MDFEREPPGRPWPQSRMWQASADSRGLARGLRRRASKDRFSGSGAEQVLLDGVLGPLEASGFLPTLPLRLMHHDRVRLDAPTEAHPLTNVVGQGVPQHFQKGFGQSANMEASQPELL